jgi:nicotinamidase/pyrazinamidase
MQKDVALLVIDAQFDFCHPQGALFVPGSEEDMTRLSGFIVRNKAHIDHITVTLDSHQVNNISHPSFWQDAGGKFPAPFTQITSADVDAGKWTPRFYPQEAIKYLRDLEANGEFPHLIWPEHCLIGSKGASLNDTLMESLKEWTRQGKFYQAVAKGTHPLTEHFGIFCAQVPIASRPETQINLDLINTLESHKVVYLAGEARSHCVATSLKQMIKFAPALASKLVILQDCMSDVTGLGHLADPIFADAKNKSIAFTDSSDDVASRLKANV